MLKRILSMVTVLSMCLSMFPTGALAASENDPPDVTGTTCTCTVPCSEDITDGACPVCSAHWGQCAAPADATPQAMNLDPTDTGHVHRVCLGVDDCACEGQDQAHMAVTWEAWDNGTALPNQAGNYYLTTDVTLSTSWSPPDGVSLCLNGYTVKGPSSYVISATNSFSITDCNGTQQTHEFTVDKTTGRWTLVQPGDNTTDLQVQTVNGGVIVSSGTNSAIYVYPNATFSLYGGTITGGQSSAGGGVFSSGKFYQYGGAISGNTAVTYGGGVYVGSSGTFYLYGGTISNNTVTYGGGAGGGIDVYGTFYMYDSTISGNTCNWVGGGVHSAEGSYVYMYGGEITQNTGTLGGGLSIIRQPC